MRIKKALKMKIPVEGKSSVSACGSTDKPDHISLNDEKLNGDPKDDDKVASTSELDGNSDMEEIVCLSDSPELFHEPSSSTEMEVPLEDRVSDSCNTMNDALNMPPSDESRDDSGNGSTTFDVGDFVWTRTQTEVWWPAVVYDPSSSATKAPKAVKRGSIFVKYFGSGCYVWCGESDLKSFFEHFSRMSSQSYSKSFSGAIEKALSLIGQVITAKMTCPCFSKEEGEEKLDQSENACELSKLGIIYSPPRFEPGFFVSRIRDMARSGLSNGKLDLTVVKNHLSAFYRSFGHCQLPLHLIKSSADSQNVGQNSASSRKRKKSKYLCYPYVNLKRKPVKDIEASPPVEKNDQKKVNELIEACSSKWLAELRLAARDHSWNSDSLTGFCVGFRKFAFASAGIALDEHTEQVSNRETPSDLSISLSSTGKMNNPLMASGAASQIKVPMALYPSIVAPKPKKKKKRKRDEVSSDGIIPDLNKPETPPPPCPGSLILVFASNNTLPPRETLITTFSRFGLLRESEIEAVDESTVRIPYERITEARFAFQSLEKNRPFGEALASFRLNVSSPPPPVKRRSYDSKKNRDRGEQQPPPIAPELMKRNVEMMKSTLEKAGASLSVEMRTKLEKEIKMFLDKVSSMS